MRAIIIEDEEYSQKALMNMVNLYCDDVTVVAAAGTVEEGVGKINEYQPDFIFLDIELPGENGFKLFDHFENPSFEVIFTTAYDQYGLSALKMAAVDYLLKPIDLEELRRAINLVRKKKELNVTAEKLNILKGNLNNLFKKLALPTSTGYTFVSLDQIIRCEAQGNYTQFFLNDKTTILVSKTLKIYSEILEEFNFFRINRGQLINLNYIKEYGRFKSPTLTLDDGTVLTLSASRREEFLEKIEGLE